MKNFLEKISPLLIIVGIGLFIWVVSAIRNPHEPSPDSPRRAHFSQAWNDYQNKNQTNYSYEIKNLPAFGK